MLLAHKLTFRVELGWMKFYNENQNPTLKRTIFTYTSESSFWRLGGGDSFGEFANPSITNVSSFNERRFRSSAGLSDALASARG